MTQLSPQILVERGFHYTAPGISGADMWQGVGHWRNKEKDIYLRGNISTARGGYLQIMGVPGLSIDSVEDLDKLISLFK